MWGQTEAFKGAAGETRLLKYPSHLGDKLSVCILWDYPKCVTVPAALWVEYSTDSRAVGAEGLSEGQGWSHPSWITLAKSSSPHSGSLWSAHCPDSLPGLLTALTISL